MYAANIFVSISLDGCGMHFQTIWVWTPLAFIKAYCMHYKKNIPLLIQSIYEQTRFSRGQLPWPLW